MNLIVALALGSVVAAPVPSRRHPEAKQVQGRWIVVKRIAQGQVFEKEDLTTLSWFIKGDRMVITRNSGDAFMDFALDPKTDPAGIDLTSFDSNERPIPLKGIYKLEKDKLTICWAYGERPARSSSPPKTRVPSSSFWSA